MAGWTTGEAARLLEMRRAGLTIYAMARLLGRTEDSVRGFVTRNGITARPRWEASEVEFLTENYPTRGARWCAARLLRTEKAVWDKARRLGLRGGA